MQGVLSDEKSGMYFSIFAEHNQRSISQVWVPLFYCLHFWDSPDLEDQIPVFISSHVQSNPVVPQGIGLAGCITEFYTSINPVAKAKHFEIRS
jgi:hypothetical protein